MMDAHAVEVSMKLFRKGGDRGGRRGDDDLGTTQGRVADLFITTAQRFGATSDYSEASVARLDGWVDRLWDPEGPRPKADELDSNTKLIGAYLGEVMIRHGGGRWVWAGDPRQPVVEIAPGGIALVLNKVYKRQVNGPQDSLAEFYAESKRRAGH